MATSPQQFLHLSLLPFRWCGWWSRVSLSSDLSLLGYGCWHLRPSSDPAPTVFCSLVLCFPRAIPVHFNRVVPYLTKRNKIIFTSEAFLVWHWLKKKKVQNGKIARQQECTTRKPFQGILKCAFKKPI